jgi:hypothetical protein
VRARPAIPRDVVLLIVLLVAAFGWGATLPWFPTLDHFFYGGLSWRGVLLPPPRGDTPGPPPTLSQEILIEQMGIFVPLLAACSAGIALGLLAGLASLVRHSSLSRRIVGLPLRAGLIALALGLAGAALGHFQDLRIHEMLGTDWVHSDRGSVPWGPAGCFVAGLTLAITGAVITGILALVSPAERTGGRR